MKLKSLCSLCVLCVSVVIYPFTTEAQRTQRLHREDLSQLEPDVRDQIKSQQASLLAAIKDPRSTDTQLSAAEFLMCFITRPAFQQRATDIVVE